MYEYILKGGILMFPIIACSVIALAVVLERVWALRGRRVMPREIIQRAEELVKRDHVEEAIALCRRRSSPLGRLIITVLKNVGQEREVLKEAVQEVGRREAALLERYVGILGTVANVTPLLGLLGTVSGMIKAFTVISVQGVGNPASLAGGISEALITTAAGLTAAIPSFLAYRYFLSRTDRTVLELEQISIHFVDMVKQPRLRTRSIAQPIRED
jgi:biopolymer transport protein ExbB